MDKFDVPLQDDELMDEVELYADLIAAANRTSEHLTPDEIDRVLGVTPHQRA